ncbi:sensor domain-containing diguanylate cyclase [Vibrio crassostreae]|uniref:sensor domain-containing diguanylate cyclase n=1 Tax=Vibrio crassostreae TaxID=246167 RepID=UPI000F4641B2|nr:diguanylate cyclase [Vibrio crassostreae]ROO76911.1 diguanylate cyclase (GGDEF)-like protein [Vibrio crassostreae]ROR70366.1 diguanylate cyclase (GGDEF)-like protein [Vibrio crassostreae]ROR75518.1 diguanylate cyclase (GGDEF)-like protein [Vibrio crassostreae]TCV32969.1 diguanylate cyclase (GGDEF)-like protein [Vibrio crassostreae]TQK40189.1 diguanylate cyclase (GGDEF)-like protein [Vibrio crassostreae]
MPHTTDPLTGLKRRTLPLVVFSVSFLITVLCFILVALNQNRALNMNLDSFANHQTLSLEAFIANDVAYIGSGANFFYSNDPENWDKFDRFAQQTINDSKSLIGLQWMQKVPADEIAEHTDKMKAKYPSYELYTIPKHEAKTYGYVLDGEPIFVASDMYPNTEANNSVLGFYSSRERFKLVLDNIKHTRKANISDKVRLLQDGLDQDIPKTGMLVYHPVFEGESDNLLGVVIGVVRTTYYFENLLASAVGDMDVYIRVTDTGFEAEDSPILFETEGYEAVSGHHITKTIELTNRDWKVDYKIDSCISFYGYLVLTGIVLVGTTISLLLAYIVNMQIREKERLYQMLDKRTEELRFLANHDSLTEVYNRRAFNKMLDKAIQRNEPFSLIGFDVDMFKGINDQFGHPAGDALLIHVIKLISVSLKEGDNLFRIGGDEFCIISSITTHEALDRYLQCILSTVSHSHCEHKGRQLSCTLSIGAAIRANENTEEILQKTDSMLYQSKSNGRNRVTIAG